MKKQNTKKENVRILVKGISFGILRTVQLLFYYWTLLLLIGAFSYLIAAYPIGGIDVIYIGFISIISIGIVYMIERITEVIIILLRIIKNG